MLWLMDKVGEHVAVPFAPRGVVHQVADNGHRDGDLQEGNEEFFHVVALRTVGLLSGVVLQCAFDARAKVDLGTEAKLFCLVVSPPRA